MQQPELSNGQHYALLRGQTLSHLHGCLDEYTGKLTGRRPSPVMSEPQARALAREQAQTQAQMLHKTAREVSDAGAAQREETRQRQRDARMERVERARGENGRFVKKK